jgi:hypothetical protein
MEPNSHKIRPNVPLVFKQLTPIKKGMKVGLRSDTTSRWFIQTLGDRVKQGLEVIERADIEFDA